MLRRACLVLGASILAPALHVSAGDERLAVVVPTYRGDLDLAVHSITNWPQSTTCSRLTQQNMDLVLYYAGGEEEGHDVVSAAADTIAKTAGRCFSNTRTVFAEVEKKDDVYPKAPSVMFYKMFLDDDVRSHLSEYDALAIIEWDVLVATDRSFEELYHAAFRVNEEFWVKGSNLESTTFHSSAEMAGMWQMVGHINGNAIYNNNDPAFVEYVDYTRARWEFEYPYDVALWLTISDFPYSWPLYQRYSNKFVTTNLIAYVGHEIVDHSRVSDAIAGQTLFIHGSGVEGGSMASVEAVRAEKGLEPRRDLRNLREGSRSLTTSMTDPYRRRMSAAEDGTRRLPTSSMTTAYSARRLSAVEDVPRVVRMLEEFTDLNEASLGNAEEGTVEEAALPKNEEEEETASFFAAVAELPFTHDLARSNLCAFIAGRADEADLSRVTVMSILSFNPGMRVAVVAEDAGLGDYERAIGNLPGVIVSGTSDVVTASLFADGYCGDDTSLILYLQAGSVVTRPFTAKDTHSPDGDVLVTYSSLRGGFQNDELARNTELVLGSVAPSFTKGTDLLLPVRANQDLRELVLRPSGETGGDPELVEAMRVMTDLDDVFAIPQVMAAHAYSKGTPGMWFISPQEWVAQNLFKAASIWEIPLLKPRYTCTIDPALQRSEIPHDVLVAGLKSNLDFFAKGGTCESGVLDIHQQL